MGSTDRTGAISGSPAANGRVFGTADQAIRRVVLLAPDDDARRALHMVLDRAGLHVAAMAELDHARRYVETHRCDAVIAGGDAAAQAMAALGTRVIALVRSRELAQA